MQNISVKFGKHNGELKPLTSNDAAKYFEFKKELAEGEIVELYVTKIANEDDATLGQLAKVHAMIKELSIETGSTFDEMKLVIKDKAGLLDPATKEFKSFANCSKKELSAAIQSCIDVGDFIGFYF